MTSAHRHALSENSSIISSESVGAGHPDKVADYISDSILDKCLEKDPNARVACETLVKNNIVVLAGEITTKAHIDIKRTVREAIREIGYDEKNDFFSARNVMLINLLGEQSSDIKVGVDAKKSHGKRTAEQGAGDQGIMFGYATDETPELMPLPIMLAHKILQELEKIRKDPNAPASKWLRPDCKSQVAMRYENGVPVHIENIVLSTQHRAKIGIRELRNFCTDFLCEIVPAEFIDDKTEFYINPTGRFVAGGPEADAGMTGRKIIVDTYGGFGRHGGGAFSGKDPSKVDRSGAYMARWVAKNIVAAKLAKRCEIQVAYAIGEPNPTSISVNTFGTGTVSDAKIVAAVERVFSFKPADIIKTLDLLRPIYRKTVNYGHFTKPNLPWEQTNRTDALRNALAEISAAGA